MPKDQFIAYRLTPKDVEALQQLALEGESDSKTAKRLLLERLYPAGSQGLTAAAVIEISPDNRDNGKSQIDLASLVLDKLNSLQERFEYEVRQSRLSKQTARLEARSASKLGADDKRDNIETLQDNTGITEPWDTYYADDDDLNLGDDAFWDNNIEPEDNEKDNSPPPNLDGLTNDQVTAFERFREFMASDEKYFRLTGYAGTGKSFLLARLMDWLATEGFKFVAASPTNKAAKNLKRIADNAGITADISTVAKLLGQQPELNTSNGKEEFISVNETNISDYAVVLIDEFSMVSKANFEEIAAQSGDTKIVYVGDAAQLPPVGEKEPVVATSKAIKLGATLNQIVRYDGEIAKVAEAIRSESKFNKMCYPFITARDNTIECLGFSEWQTAIAELFTSREYKANPDYVRILVWRNDTAAKLNKLVRSHLWGDNPPEFCIGDRLIARKPVFREVPVSRLSSKKKREWRIILNNSEECEVSGEAVKLTSPEGWEYWSVPTKFNGSGKVDLQILTPGGEKLRDAKVKELQAQKEWRQVSELNKRFDETPFAYAITTHKAQGSSIDNVLIDIQDMRGCPDLQKMQYTALTRAKVKALIMF